MHRKPHRIRRHYFRCVGSSCAELWKGHRTSTGVVFRTLRGLDQSRSSAFEATMDASQRREGRVLSFASFHSANGNFSFLPIEHLFVSQWSRFLGVAVSVFESSTGDGQGVLGKTREPERRQPNPTDQLDRLKQGKAGEGLCYWNLTSFGRCRRSLQSRYNRYEVVHFV